MKVLFYIIIAIIAIVAIFVIGVFLHTIYELATGKVSIEEQERRISVYECYKKQKRSKKQAKHRGGSLHFLSYPSPLNNWGLWK